MSDAIDELKEVCFRMDERQKSMERTLEKVHETDKEQTELIRIQNSRVTKAESKIEDMQDDILELKSDIDDKSSAPKAANVAGDADGMVIVQFITKYPKLSAVLFLALATSPWLKDLIQYIIP